MPAAMSDNALADDALTSINALANRPRTELVNQFIQDFLDDLDASIFNSEINLISHKIMPYRLRVSFSDNYRKGDIDFTYDGSFTWTAAQEVGGPGRSQGLYEEVQDLMTAYKGKLR